jgi:hypothetical protein
MNDDAPVSAPLPAMGTAARPRRPSLPNFVSFVMAVALVWLGGQFIRQGVSDNLLNKEPELAMLWLGDSSDAIGRLARLRLQTRDASGAARLAMKSLQLSPLNEPALTTYGLAMDALHQPAIANRAMTLAGQRGWRDLLTQIWLFRRDLLAADFEDAVDHADALLRRVPEPPPAVFAILAVAARDPSAIGPLADRLAADPNWRLPFFIFLCAQARPPATGIAGQLLTRMAAGPSPPSDEEVGPYLVALAGQGKYQEAEAAWRQLTPGGGYDGYVHDGDFRRPARATPFDWALASGVGWTATIADSPDPSHGRALRIDYDGVSTPQPLRQLVVVPPGAYRLSGSMLDVAGGGQGFVWRVACAGAADPLARAAAPAGAAGQWRTFSADFTVPATACPAQVLDLRVEEGDRPQDITVWYDDLAIAPASPVAPKTQGSAASSDAKPKP